MNKKNQLLSFLMGILLVSAFILPQWLQAQTVAQSKKVAPAAELPGAKFGGTSELRRYVEDMREVHVGMTRGELQKIFHPQPGLSDGHTWVYNHCSSVWMKVTLHESSDPSFDRFGIQFEGSLSDPVTVLGSPHWDNHIQGSD